MAFVQHPYLNVGLLYLTKTFQVSLERRPFYKLYGNCRLILYIVSQNVQAIERYEKSKLTIKIHLFDFVIIIEINN